LEVTISNGVSSSLHSVASYSRHHMDSRENLAEVDETKVLPNEQKGI